MEKFSNNLVTALKDPDVQTILKNIFRAAHKQTSDAIQELQNTLVKLHADLKSRDAIIAQLKYENSLLQERIDELEQHSRKSPIRVFGIPETTGALSADKNVFIWVLYKPPNTDIEIFNEYLGNVLDKVGHEKKLSYIMGDYNINILNYDSHTETALFLDTLYSKSFIPLINRSTRDVGDIIL